MINMKIKVHPEHEDTRAVTLNANKGFRVQILEPSETESARAFCKELSKQMKCGMVMLKDALHINKDIPLVVVCYNHSRIGTDIDAAISGLNDVINKEKTAIVVMHVTQRHALPQIMPIENLTEGSYDDYGLLVDFFYTHDEKIYKCDLNSKARDELKKFLKKHIGEGGEPHVMQKCSKYIAVLVSLIGKSWLGKYTRTEILLVIFVAMLIGLVGGLMYYVATVEKD